MEAFAMQTVTHRTLIATAAALLAAASLSAPSLAQGQGPAQPTMVDLAGSWAMSNEEELLIRVDPGPELGNFTGFPLNAAGRQKALSWNSTIQAVPEHQARPHPAQYSMRGPGPNFHMGEIIDPVSRRLIGYTITGLFENANRTIWLDGRPHPSVYAEHLWNGFSTGEWENGMLKVTTTHMKQAFLQRNGIPSSPYGVMTEYFIRHGNLLLMMSQVDDPIYLEEPMVRTSTWRWSPGQREGAIGQVEIAEELPDIKLGDVPHYPLGTRHPEYADANGLPFDATLGGKDTIYPEYADTLKQLTRERERKETRVETRAQANAAPTHSPIRPTYASRGEIQVLPVQGSVYLLAGAGSNITVQIGSDAVMVVDSNEAAMSPKVLAAIRTLSSAPIRYIVNTSSDPDHVGGNEALAKSAEGSVNAILGQGARVYAQENTFSRMANPKDGSSPMPTAILPTDAFSAPKKTMFVTGEPVEFIHQPTAHTDGDLIVFFRKSDVVAAGDVFVLNGYPVIDTARGGSLQGVLDALNRIIDITIPEFNAMGGTRVIPGHGRIANEIDVVEYRDMLTIIRDRVMTIVEQGGTLEDVKAARVTLDYDGVYGVTSGSWTTDRFLETAFKELSAVAAKTRLSSRAAPRVRPTPERTAASENTKTATAIRRTNTEPFDGDWVLNTFKSQYVPSSTMPYRREMTLAFADGGFTHTTSTWRRTNGNDSPLARTTYTAKLDGKEYAVTASSAKVTFKRVDASTIERTALGDRGATERATWTISGDRNTLTIVTTGKDAAGADYSSTQVYERR
jgi:cyclase